jgi:tRNA threonylcarbamoyladenosine biosynthesis protein TsaB
MLRLALDGATEFLSIALADGEGILAVESACLPRGAENFFATGVAQCLQRGGRRLCDVEEFICTTGPGSFTGVRVTMATALGLSLGCGRPLYGLDTLRALALAAPDGAETVAAVLHAKRNEIYGAVYEKTPDGLRERLPARAEAPAEFIARLGEARPVFIGTAEELFAPGLLPDAMIIPMPFLAATLLGGKARPLLALVDPARPIIGYLRDAATTPQPAPSTS